MIDDALDGVTAAPGNHRGRDERGETMFDTRADPDFVLPTVQFSASTPKHTIENTGSDVLVVIGVELKAPADGHEDRGR